MSVFDNTLNRVNANGVIIKSDDLDNDVFLQVQSNGFQNALHYHFKFENQIFAGFKIEQETYGRSNRDIEVGVNYTKPVVTEPIEQGTDLSIKEGVAFPIDGGPINPPAASNVVTSIISPTELKEFDVEVFCKDVPIDDGLAIEWNADFMIDDDVQVRIQNVSRGLIERVGNDYRYFDTINFADFAISDPDDIVNIGGVNLEDGFLCNKIKFFFVVNVNSPYTDEGKRAEYSMQIFFESPVINLFSGLVDKLTFEYGRTLKNTLTNSELLAIGKSFPQVRSDSDFNTSPTFVLPNLNFSKDASEILGFVYQLNLIPKNDEDTEFIIGEKLTSANPLIGGDPNDLYIWVNTQRYDEFDRKLIKGYDPNDSVNFGSVGKLKDFGDVSLTKRIFLFAHLLPGGQLNNGETWAIGDSKGKLYLAMNYNYKLNGDVVEKTKPTSIVAFNFRNKRPGLEQ
jgi:hypothetical protein